MTSKSFFTEPKIGDISKLERVVGWRGNTLIEKISSIDPLNQHIEIACNLIPGKFMNSHRHSADNAKKFYKHGEFFHVRQEKTVETSKQHEKIPRESIYQSLDNTLLEMNPSENFMLGYSFKPVKGADKRTRKVPFVWLLEGARLFTYAMQTQDGLPVRDYTDARKVGLDGGSVVVTVPSRREKEPRYIIRVESVPVADTPEKFALWKGITTSYAEGRAPDHSLWNIGYKEEASPEGSRNAITLYPHDIAAYWAIEKYFMKEKDNIVPRQMSPFPIPTPQLTEFYMRLCENVIKRDPKVDRGVRKLYVAEKSVLLARFIGEHGSHETLHWDSQRHPKLTEYAWKR